MSMPELSPLVAANLVCRECGEIIKPKVVMGNRGHKKIASHVEYVHVNAKTGCNYKLESTVMTTSEMRPLRADGSVINV